MANPPYNGEAPTTTFVKTERTEDRTPPWLAAIPYTITNKPDKGKAEEKCGWGPHCPICEKSIPNPKAEITEDWNSKRQDNLQRNYTLKALNILQHMTFLIDSLNSIS